MYRIGVVGNKENYFFSEIVKTFSINNSISFDLNDDKLDFIFCVNDIRPLIKNKKVPIVTWIGERPTWTYLWKSYGLSASDLIFLTEKEFVEPVKKITGNNNVFFLPLATSFGETGTGLKLYKHRVLFVGNTMQKQLNDMENEENILLALPLSSEIRNAIWEEVNGLQSDSFDFTINDFMKMSSVIKENISTINKYSLARKDLIHGYIGMVLTHSRRRHILLKLHERYSDMQIVPSEWRTIINDVGTSEKIDYIHVNNFYAESMININISSMHMPTAVNSRVFDVPISSLIIETVYMNCLILMKWLLIIVLMNYSSI